jgi:hypothetical protein
MQAQFENLIHNNQRLQNSELSFSHILQVSVFKALTILTSVTIIKYRGIIFVWKLCYSLPVGLLSLKFSTFNEEYVCQMFRMFASQRETFLASSLYTAGETILTAVYWNKTRRFRLKAIRSTGERCAAYRGAKRSLCCGDVSCKIE